MENDTYRDLEYENKKNLLFYHHARPLEHSPYAVVKQVRDLDIGFEGAYLWLEKEVGFYPLFLAVGATEEDRKMTGYQNQWRKILGGRKGFREYRKKGEIDNQVLFSFTDIQDGIFMDYGYWDYVRNGEHDNYVISKRVRNLIFRPTWNKDKWLQYANKEPDSVQLIVPELDLRKANSIWVRNRKTQKQLEGIGFRDIKVRRMTFVKWK